MEHAVGTLLADRYQLRREIARSPQAVLFEARQTYLGRTVAVKLLCGDARRDEAARSRLVREAQLLSRARHPAVVEVLDCGNSAEHDPYLATEMLDGRLLDGLLAARKRLDIDDAVSLAITIGEALGAAHQRLLVHGALGPASIFLPTRLSASPGQPRLPAKLLDFGLAPNPASVADGALAAMGYAAPELLAGAPPEPRSDVYSVGAVLYECLTGELPEVAVNGMPRSPAAHRPDLPSRLTTTVLTALSDAESRYQDMASFIATLAHVHTEVPPPSLPPKLRRRFPRAPFVTPVRVVRSAGGTTDGRSEDISEGGMLVVGASGVERTEQVQIRFALPTAGDIVSLTARVCWTRSARAGKDAIGFEFSDPPTEICADIEQYVGFWTGDDASGRR